MFYWIETIPAWYLLRWTHSHVEQNMSTHHSTRNFPTIMPEIIIWLLWTLIKIMFVTLPPSSEPDLGPTCLPLNLHFSARDAGDAMCQRWGGQEGDDSQLSRKTAGEPPSPWSTKSVPNSELNASGRHGSRQPSIPCFDNYVRVFSTR